MNAKVKLAAVASTSLVLAGAAWLGAAERRMATQRDACASSCHANLDGTHQAAHASQSCQSCHDVERSSALALVAGGWLTGIPAHGAVIEDACTSCHVKRAGVTSDTPALTLAAHTPGHRAHATGEAATTCAACHQEHEGRSERDICSGCHDGGHVHDQSVAGAEDADACTTCHAFASSAGREGAFVATVVDRCARCHGAPSQTAGETTQASHVVSSEILHGEVGCDACHQPKGSAHHALEPNDCARCHGGVTANMSASDGEPAGHQSCVGCHAPHAAQRDAVVACIACHAEQAARRGATARSAALEHDDCHSCHAPHTWAAERAGCVKCHDETATVLSASAPKEHGSCRSCHAPHAPPPTAGTCTSCHEPLKRVAEAAPATHRSCVSCHAPHGAASEARGACTGCHQAAQQQLTAAAITPHQKSCLSCHQRHGAPAAGTSGCVACHQTEATLAAKSKGKHQTCTSCHASHGFAVTDVAAACSTCHETAAATGGSHKGTCESCHAPHGPAAVAQTACV